MFDMQIKVKDFQLLSNNKNIEVVLAQQMVLLLIQPGLTFPSAFPFLSGKFVYLIFCPMLRL